jgi:L-aminopeptidase/D-esterase-like protein
LAAADGVVGALEEQGIGFPTGAGPVPIVPAAVLFDLGIGDPSVRPGPAAGRAAVASASTEVAEGSVGAGTGATVGKWAGREFAVKGGIGTASASAGQGCVVGALVACNAIGDVLDERGEVLAGSRAGTGAPWVAPWGEATVIGVVATNGRLDKADATHVARMSVAGIARAVRPAHTSYDGDLLFVAATGEVEADPTLLGAMGAEVVAEAIRRGVRAAAGLAGVPGLR